jgi:flagellin-like hook-associated protein FlgL
MFGVRADYAVDKNFNLGATALKLFERHFTQKVNIGEDPINNSIYGFDLGISRDAPFLTKIVDALPGISTKAKSSINFTGETALIRPGHSRAINQNNRDKGGVVYIDDFEGSASSLDLRQPVTNWVLASVPQNDAFNNNPLFPEASLVNDLRYGSNRAKLSWYRIDLGARGTDQDAKNPYTSQVPQIEVFPNAQIAPNQLPNIPTFDMTYYPENRGPYNFDVPGGYPGISKGAKFIGDSMVLDNPGSRWGGVMSALNTNDFQSSNIEFLEFWVLSPFLDPADPKTIEGVKKSFLTKTISNQIGRVEADQKQNIVLPAPVINNYNNWSNTDPTNTAPNDRITAILNLDTRFLGAASKSGKGDIVYDVTDQFNNLPLFKTRSGATYGPKEVQYNTVTKQFFVRERDGQGLKTYDAQSWRDVVVPLTSGTGYNPKPKGTPR